jgi:signal transduction histidine kinase
MKNLKVLLSDSPDPVFIVNKKTMDIHLVNDSVIEKTGFEDPSGRKFGDIVHVGELSDISFPAFFSGEWYEISSERFDWKNEIFLKMALKRRKSIPDTATFSSLKNMMAVLIHRLRSPLTGMQGYLELMETDITSEKNLQRYHKLSDGLDRLFDIMDEMEELHDIPVGEAPIEKVTWTDVMDVLDDILRDYPHDVSEKVKIRKQLDGTVFPCNRSHLKKILGILIENAREHSQIIGSEIIITVQSPALIKINNAGTPIPPDLTQKLFYPFVTTKANRLGLGLTMAELLAQKVHGAVFLTHNNNKEGITFSLYFPPLN